ncbi:MAG TPA: alpha/beta fold hydrolase [Pseudonocardiaceae bacterium]
MRPRVADRTMSYGPGDEHVAEIWTGGSRVLAVVHGGFWAAEYDRCHIRPLCAALADRGYTVVAIEYHRVGQRDGAHIGGWPGTFTDVAAAVDALPRLTGGIATDDSTVLIGHSAGGHLALWTALRDRLPAGGPGSPEERLSPKGVVALAAVSDLVSAHRLDLDAGAVDRLLCGAPEELAARYWLADPIQLLPTSARCVLVHGDLDDRVPQKQSVDFHRAAIAAGVDAHLMALPGVGHFEVIDPTSTVFDTVLAAIDTAFDAPGVAHPVAAASVSAAVSASAPVSAR